MQTDLSVVNLNIDYSDKNLSTQKITTALENLLPKKSVISIYGKGNFTYDKISEIKKNLSKRLSIESHYHKYHKKFQGIRKDIYEISSTQSDTILILSKPADYYFSARFIYQNKNKNIKRIIFLKEFEKKFIYSTGIYINIPEIYNHFKNVIDSLNKNSVCIIIHHSLKKIHFKKTLEKSHDISVFYDDYLSENSLKVDTLITTSHLHFNHSNISPIEVISNRKAFFHYSLGFSKYYYNNKLKLYDYIFTYGSYSANKIRKFTNSKIYTIGYPRYEYVSRLSKNDCIKKLKIKINHNKPILSWMPSIDEFSSFKRYHSKITKILQLY